MRPSVLATALAVATVALLAGWPQPLGARPAAASKSAALSTSESAAPQVEARADETIRKMAALLAQTRAFTVEAEETFDTEFARAYRVQLSNVRTLTLERPSRFSATAVGDSLHRASWYDGKTLTVLDGRRNTYASLPMPGSIDGVLDTLAADYSVFLPLSDLFYSDPYKALMGDVLYGKYLGTHQVGGVPCHHLSFGQEGVEWQIWIDASDKPLPRKLTIAYWDQPGVPQYQAVFRKWVLAPAIPPDQFRFTPPAGAQRVEIAEFAGSSRSAER